MHVKCGKIRTYRLTTITSFTYTLTAQKDPCQQLGMHTSEQFSEHLRKSEYSNVNTYIPSRVNTWNRSAECGEVRAVASRC